jgi:hypothetical protein
MSRLLPRLLRVRVLSQSVFALFAPTLLAQQPQPIAPPLRPGFPVTLRGSGPVRTPAVGDLDNDGLKEIVVGTASGNVYVINSNGSIRLGWPKRMPATVAGGIAIGDVDGDGFPDIVVPFKFTDLTGTGGRGGVRAYKRDGTLIWERLTFTDQRNDGVYSTPAIGNVDGVPGNEVVFGSFDMRVYVVHGTDGTDLPGWPKFVRDTVWSSPALADLNGDGKPEVIIGVDTHLEGPPYNTPDGGALHVYEWDGTELAGFPQYIDQAMMSSPAIGDIDGDGNPEIVVGGGSYYTGAVGKKVYAYHCDGTPVTGWPVSVDNQVFNSPALADIDGNGKLDVVISDADPTGASGLPPHVYAIRGDGTLIFKVVAKSFFRTSPNADTPIVADVTGDGLPEVLVSVNTEIAVLSRTGVQLTDDGSHDGRESYYTPTAVSSAVVTDLDNDGLLDVVAGSATPFPSGTDGQVYVWNPANATSNRPWPAFHQDPASRRGVAPGTASCAPPPPQNFYTLTPCRAVDTRNPNGPLGGPPMAAMTTRDFPIRGNCGIPSTARSVAINVTVTGSTSYGDLRLYPSGGPGPNSSTIDWNTGQTRANNAIMAFGSNGSITVWCVMFSGSTNVIIDVVGYFQ